MNRLSAVLALCLPAAMPAFALPCGSVLTAPVVLAADVVCGPGQDGLIVGDHKVRIELNGFSIVGPYTAANPTGPSIGVRSSGFESVQIVGPGTISGFERAIELEGGGNHLVSGLTALAPLPVSVRNASGVVVELNRMNALELSSDPGARAVANRILDNDIGPDPAMLGPSLVLGGCGTADNVVAYNRVDARTQRAIKLHDGAYSNQVLKNKVVEGEIFLDGASHNLVADNLLASQAFGAVGVMIDASIAPVACAGGKHLLASRNIVRGNRVRSGGTGMAVVVDDTTFSGVPTANVVTGNTFQDQFAGLVFGLGATGNDGRGNTYFNVATPVYDFGTGNLWP